MSASRQPLENEISSGELIQCPRQPGRLRISKRSCGLRYLQAQRITREIPNDEFDMVRRMGLEICRTCPEGKRNAGGLVSPRGAFVGKRRYGRRGRPRKKAGSQMPEKRPQ